MRHNKLPLRKSASQLGDFKRRRLIGRRFPMRTIIGVIQHRPTLCQSRFGHHPSTLVGRMLAHPKLQGAKTLPAPVFDLRKRVVGMGRVDITEGQDPLPNRVAQPGGILVALYNLRRRRIITTGQVAENDDPPQSKTIQTLAQISRVGEEAPIVRMRVDHSEAPQFLDQSHANTSRAFWPSRPRLSPSCKRAPAKPNRLPFQ